jgi:hypothetical protein
LAALRENNLMMTLKVCCLKEMEARFFARKTFLGGKLL